MPIPLGVLAVAGAGAAGAGAAYELISTGTGTGSSAAIEFTNIPTTYQHLQIRFVGKQTGSGEVDSYIQFNNSTASGNYTFYHQLYGYNSSITSNADTGTTDKAIAFYTTGTNDSNVFGAGIMDILDYKSTNKNKTIRILSGMKGTNGFIGLRSAMWRPATAVAIESIKITVNSNNWDSATRISLYGLRSA